MVGGENEVAASREQLIKNIQTKAAKTMPEILAWLGYSIWSNPIQSIQIASALLM